MLYKLLGMLVWKGAKVVLRHKYGPTYLPRPGGRGRGGGAGLVVGLVLAKRDTDYPVCRRVRGPAGTRRSVWDHRAGDGIRPCLDPRRPHVRGGRVAAVRR